MDFDDMVVESENQLEFSLDVTASHKLYYT